MIIRNNKKIEAVLFDMDGVHEFINRCQVQGLKLAVASSADLVKVNINLNEIGLERSLFGAIV